MTDRELDAILGEEPEIEPSKEFASGVMNALRREVATPPPLRFPWICVIPALVTWALAVAALIAAPFVGAGAPEKHLTGFGFGDSFLRSLFELARQMFYAPQASWIALALLLTLVCVGFPLRLVRGKL